MLQKTVQYQYTTGFRGDVIKDGPIRALPFRLNSQTTVPNTIGCAFTYDSEVAASGGSPSIPVAKVGGTGVFAGILINSKEHASYGNLVDGPLGPTMALPPNISVELATMGFVVVQLNTAANYGDPVYFSPDAVGGDEVGGLYASDRATPGRVLIPNARVEQPIPEAGLTIIRLTQ